MVLVMIDGIGTVTATVTGPSPQPTLHTAVLTKKPAGIPAEPVGQALFLPVG